MTRRIAASSVCLVALTVIALGFAPSAGASLGGARLSSLAVAMRWTFNQPGSPVPAEPTGEMTQAYSLAEFSSGPSTHGLASVMWPGSAGADFGPVYGLPAYPVRAEAFNPSTPHKAETDYGPYTTMHATANDTSAEADTTWQQSEQQLSQALATGDYASSAGTQVKGDVAVSVGTAEAHDVSLAGGLIHIDSVITTGRAVTNGKTGRVGGKTTVSGVTIQGQGVTVDDKGVHVADQTVPVLDPINGGQLQQTLDQVGVTMKVADPIDTVKGSEAQRVLGGLVITFDDGALNQLADQIPSLKQYVNFNQSVTMSIGAVTVDSETLGGYTIPTPPTPPTQPPSPPPPAGGGAPVSTGGPFGGLGGGSTSVPPTNPTAPAPTGPVATAPVSLPLPQGKAVPAALVAIGLLLAAGSSRILKVVADRAVSGVAADRCPLEDA